MTKKTKEKVGSTKSFRTKDVVPETAQDQDWHATEVSAESTTNLEDDPGLGTAAIIRFFEFAANPEAFAVHTPTRQELFNYHLKQIELELWKDGLQVMTDVTPQITIAKDKTKYRIAVGSRPARGHILSGDIPTLTDILHGKRS